MVRAVRLATRRGHCLPRRRRASLAPAPRPPLRNLGHGHRSESGIGRSVALKLTRLGVKLVLVGHDPRLARSRHDAALHRWDDRFDRTITSSLLKLVSAGVVTSYQLPLAPLVHPSDWLCA